MVTIKYSDMARNVQSILVFLYVTTLFPFQSHSLRYTYYTLTRIPLSLILLSLSSCPQPLLPVLLSLHPPQFLPLSFVICFSYTVPLTPCSSSLLSDSPLSSYNFLSLLFFFALSHFEWDKLLDYLFVTPKLFIFLLV